MVLFGYMLQTVHEVYSNYCCAKYDVDSAL